MREVRELFKILIFNFVAQKDGEWHAHDNEVSKLGEFPGHLHVYNTSIH